MIERNTFKLISKADYPRPGAKLENKVIVDFNKNGKADQEEPALVIDLKETTLKPKDNGFELMPRNMNDLQKAFDNAKQTGELKMKGHLMKKHVKFKFPGSESKSMEEVFNEEHNDGTTSHLNNAEMYLLADGSGAISVSTVRM